MVYNSSRVQRFYIPMYTSNRVKRLEMDPAVHSEMQAVPSSWCPNWSISPRADRSKKVTSGCASWFSTGASEHTSYMHIKWRLLRHAGGPSAVPEQAGGVRGALQLGRGQQGHVLPLAGATFALPFSLWLPLSLSLCLSLSLSLSLSIYIYIYIYMYIYVYIEIFIYMDGYVRVGGGSERSVAYATPLHPPTVRLGIPRWLGKTSLPWTPSPELKAELVLGERHFVPFPRRKPMGLSQPISPDQSSKTWNSKPHTVNLNAESRVLYFSRVPPEPWTLNLNPEPWTWTLNPRPWTLKPRP